MAYETILVDTRNAVGVITLNRPKALNALCAQLIEELNSALDDFEADEGIKAIVLTGSARAFAAGADISEMKDKDFISVTTNDFLEPWERITRLRKPVIAAVAGYALGGGCELAMMCDIITGRMMDAEEAERSGLVSRVVPADELLDEALALAGKIAGMSAPVAAMAKDAVNRAFEVSLAEGVRFERRLFQSTFATDDRREGMAAFVEKRPADFSDS